MDPGRELESVCGLGTVMGLHEANCYHDYTVFVPGVSVRNYSDEELDQMMAEENTPKSYNGKEYTTYEALQEQSDKRNIPIIGSYFSTRAFKVT